MVVVFWLITPFQSALMGTGSVSKTKPGSLTNRSALLPLEKQYDAINIDILNSAYALAWLEQPFPSFTTANYAILPFHVGDSPAPAGLTTTWTATTTKYWTELNCWAAEVQDDRTTYSHQEFYFLNGQGCNASNFFDTSNTPKADYRMLYIGYGGDALSTGLLGPKCKSTPDLRHQFLSIWGKVIEVPGSKDPDWNITARFCQTSYYKQQVLATVNSVTLEPDVESVSPLAEKEILSEEEFNSTAFEYMLFFGSTPNGISVGNNINVFADFPESITPSQTSQLNGTNLELGHSPMVGFALAGQNYTMDEYSSPDILDKAYSRAHQYLFSLTINKLLANENQFPNNTASVEFSLTGIVVSRTFSIVVECLLVLAACFTGVLLWCCRTAESNLAANPSSISRLLDLARNSPDILNAFQITDNADEKTLAKTFQRDRFKLSYDQGQGCSQVHIIRGSESLPITSERKLSIQKGYYDPVRPLMLQRTTGIVFMVALVSAVVGLSYLKRREEAHNG